MESEKEGVRIDKWLWSVRIFKSRSISSEACAAGKVKIGGQSVKASRNVKVGEIITVQKDLQRFTLKVKQLLERRVSAKLAVDFVEDLTPPEEREKVDLLINVPLMKRDRGTGRPTKKERREIDDIIL